MRQERRLKEEGQKERARKAKIFLERSNEEGGDISGPEGGTLTSFCSPPSYMQNVLQSPTRLTSSVDFWPNRVCSRAYN